MSAPAEQDARYREPLEDRWGRDVTHTEPVNIEVRTRWLYSETEKDGQRVGACACCPGRHAFSRSAQVVRSDVPAWAGSVNDLHSHLRRAVDKFGDDADLIIEVRRRTPEDVNQ